MAFLFLPRSVHAAQASVSFVGVDASTEVMGALELGLVVERSSDDIVIRPGSAVSSSLRVRVSYDAGANVMRVAPDTGIPVHVFPFAPFSPRRASLPTPLPSERSAFGPFAAPRPFSPSSPPPPSRFAPRPAPSPFAPPPHANEGRDVYGVPEDVIDFGTAGLLTGSALRIGTAQRAKNML